MQVMLYRKVDGSRDFIIPYKLGATCKAVPCRM